MLEPLTRKPKLDADGHPTPGCWLTNSGYTIAEVHGTPVRFTITRPGGSAPFAYTSQPGDLEKLITADMQACAAMDQSGEAV